MLVIGSMLIKTSHADIARHHVQNISDWKYKSWASPKFTLLNTIKRQSVEYCIGLQWENAKLNLSFISTYHKTHIEQQHNGVVSMLLLCPFTHNNNNSPARVLYLFGQHGGTVAAMKAGQVFVLHCSWWQATGLRPCQSKQQSEYKRLCPRATLTPPTEPSKLCWSEAGKDNETC